MFAFRLSLVIRRPPADVFGLFIRFEEIPKYVPQLTSAEQTSPGEVSVGTTFVQRARFLGRTVETPTVVTTFEPYTRFGYRADEGPLPYEAHYAFTPSDEGTLLEADVRVRPPRLARPLQPLLGRLVPRVYARNLDRMRTLLEAGQ
jgi:hypothetical protein